jgi:hypothetical protein
MQASRSGRQSPSRSWKKIGEILGTSAQAAQQRYSAVVEQAQDSSESPTSTRTCRSRAAAVRLSGLTLSHIGCSTAAPQAPRMGTKPLVIAF